MAATVSLFGKLPDGRPVHRYELENDRLQVELIDFGATLHKVEAPRHDGHWENITLGFAHVEEYLDNRSCMGSTVGRFANRIGRGRFTLDGRQYQLAVNNGPNHLHGGIQGFAHKLWQGRAEGSSVVFEYTSPDGEEGYPGNLHVTVTYHLEGAELTISYLATSDAPTIVNLTNHAYWNLAGASGGTVYDHELLMYANQYLECDADVLPTGRILDVEGTAYDFRTRQRIGSRIDQTPGGYDHCFVVNGDAGTLRAAAKAVDPKSGRCMVVHTTTPGIQLYTANHFDGSPATARAPRHGAFCLECQGFPDSPNQPSFPSAVLRPGETYRQTTLHRFSTE